MGCTVGVNDLLAFECVAELEDCILVIKRVGGNCSCGVGGRASLEDTFNVYILNRGEGGEFGVVGSELGKNLFFVGGSDRDVVEWLTS